MCPYLSLSLFKRTVLHLQKVGVCVCVYLSLFTSCLTLSPSLSPRFGTDPSRYVVRLGDYHTVERDDFERTLTPERIVVHRKYQSQGWEYDIALLKLKGSGAEGSCVAFNPHTNAACLPGLTSKRSKRPAACVITGWGITGNNNTLRIIIIASFINKINDFSVERHIVQKMRGVAPVARIRIRENRCGPWSQKG